MNPGGARRVGLVQRVGERINMDGYLAGGGSLGSAAGWRMVRAEGRRGRCDHTAEEPEGAVSMVKGQGRTLRSPPILRRPARVWLRLGGSS
jgi:hypothetical protein